MIDTEPNRTEAYRKAVCAIYRGEQPILVVRNFVVLKVQEGWPATIAIDTGIAAALTLSHCGVYTIKSRACTILAAIDFITTTIDTPKE